MLRSWLQLLRAPNLFTVPGDPLAGFLLASGGRVDARLALAILASLCFYSHGLVLNDLADLDEDRRDRPKRPLPSGAVSPPTAWIAAVLLALAALLFCLAINTPVLILGVVLLGSVILYNLWSKKVAVVGALNMGLCRGLSLILGASAAVSTPAEGWHAGDLGRVLAALPILGLAAAVGLTLYIAAVTNLARIETLPDPPESPRALPFYALIAVVLPFFIAAIDRSHPLSTANLWLYLVSAYTLYAGFKVHSKLTRSSTSPIPPMIGQLIRLLLPLQAAFCIASRSITGGIAAAGLIVLWPVSRTVSKRFYAS
jgi:4-hydroxybenzoate polyprenyltransferase